MEFLYLAQRLMAAEAEDGRGGVPLNNLPSLGAPGFGHDSPTELKAKPVQCFAFSDNM